MKKIKKEVNVGGVIIGGNTLVKVQSMTTQKVSNQEKTREELNILRQCGCDIVRVAVCDEDDARSIKNFIDCGMPIVADIHFDYKLAILSIENGASKVRVNPGNLGEENFKKVIQSAKQHNVPIRIGANCGSISMELLNKYKNKEKAIISSIIDYIRVCQDNNFDDIVLSVKSSDVFETIKLNRRLHELFEYPLHIGVTEAGTMESGYTKNAIGIGALLCDGIGDTIRVSLSESVEKEVMCAKQILKDIGLIGGVKIISCPTCGRKKADIISLAHEVEAKTKNIKKNITIAVMGCEVNGPGEARMADIGIAGATNGAVLFKKGKQICLIERENAVAELIKLIETMD